MSEEPAHPGSPLMEPGSDLKCLGKFDHPLFTTLPLLGSETEIQYALCAFGGPGSLQASAN